MKLIFFGSSNFSIPILKTLLSSKHSVVHVVTTPDKKKGRGQKLSPSVVKVFAKSHNLTVSNPDKLSGSSLADEIKIMDLALLVIASYGKLVPSSIFSAPNRGSLNVHPSLLPRHRGASPIQQAILAGDEKTGVSIAEVTNELDAGDIFAQAETRIQEDENANELGERLAAIASTLLLHVIQQVEQGKAAKTKQDSSKATYTRKISRGNGKIDWTKTALQIHNEVRAYYPWPSSFTFFRGNLLKVIETKLVNQASLEAKPGTILKVDPHASLWVQTESGPLALMRVQPEGRREMTGFEFAIGRRIRQGDWFDLS